MIDVWYPGQLPRLLILQSWPFFDKIYNLSIITTDDKKPRTLSPPENWVSSNNSTEGDPLRRQFYHASEPTRGELKLAGYNDRLPHRS